MTLVQAKQQATLVGKDLVVRNVKRDPPICRITDYRKELMKKWFKTLSKEFKTVQSKKKKKEDKAKAVHLTTNISAFDLEAKKKKSIDFLKQFSTL